MAWRLAFWKRPTLPVIRCGQKWRLKSAYHDASPWPKTPPTPDYGLIVILDSRAGWVRFFLGEAFPDERMTEEVFRACYEPAENDAGVLRETKESAEIGSAGMVRPEES